MWAVFAVALAASLAALAWCIKHRALLLYGDAVAHLHIARRIIDSHSPGPQQLGSVWLPLPHLLLVPFVAVNAWWHNGLAGALPSMACYVVASVGIYLLARKWMEPIAAFLVLAFFAGNPNLLYLQATAMTEPLFLCEMIWAVLWLVEWREGREQALPWATGALVASVFTRYDGWIFAFFAWIAVAVIIARRGELRSRRFVWITSVIAVAPVLWFAYNWGEFGDPLDFMRGPYSARAIEDRSSHGALYPHPGWHSMRVAAIFFLKAAKMDAMQSAWGNWFFALVVCGTVGAVIAYRKHAILWAMLLWIPLPFYAYSVAYGSVPIFLPVWWPHSWYNTRYGMEMLPAFALFAGFCVAGWAYLLRSLRAQLGRVGGTVLMGSAVAAAYVLLLLNFLAMIEERPLVYAEAVVNSRTRMAFEAKLADALRALPAGGEILINTSAFAGAMEQVDFPLKRTVTESDFVIFGEALRAPATHVAYVVSFDGDEVDLAVRTHPEHLRLLRVVASDGQPVARVYASDTPPGER